MWWCIITPTKINTSNSPPDPPFPFWRSLEVSRLVVDCPPQLSSHKTLSKCLHCCCTLINIVSTVYMYSVHNQLTMQFPQWTIWGWTASRASPPPPPWHNVTHICFSKSDSITLSRWCPMMMGGTPKAQCFTISTNFPPRSTFSIWKEKWFRIDVKLGSTYIVKEFEHNTLLWIFPLGPFSSGPLQYCFKRLTKDWVSESGIELLEPVS